MVKVAILVDTPNIGKSIAERYSGGARPDYRALRYLARKYGDLWRACALVNDGVNPHFAKKLTDLRFEVKFSHAFDCDDALIAWAVRLGREASCIILCSGDKHFIPIAQLLMAVGMKIVVCAVDGACNEMLKSIAHAYEEMPATHIHSRKSVVRVSQITKISLLSDVKNENRFI